MGNHLTLAAAVFPIFLLLAIGAGVRRLHWLQPAADETLMNLVVKILYPCLILGAVLDNAAVERMENLLVAPVLGGLTVLLGFAVAALVLPALKAPSPAAARTFVFTVGLFNYGYLPIPIVQQLFDRETLGVLLLFNVGVEIAFWTVGILLLTGISPLKGWKQILNPPAIALFTALILNFTGLAALLPEPLLRTVGLLGGCAIPLGLLLIGATLFDSTRAVKDAERRRWRVPLIACGVRLGILPALFLLLAILLPISPELQRVLLIQAAMPAAIFPIVIARHYGGHPETALAVVLGTTLVSLLTIPLWLSLGKLWLGL